MWTQFWDMHSGGGQKEKWAMIYIEAPEEEAKVIFYNKFGHNPERVTCTCCGEDYSLHEDEDLAQLTGYHRNCDHDGRKYIEKPDARYNREKKLTPLEEYIQQEDVLVIYAKDIKPEEREGYVPEQGYVWMG
jgi:hypothetical protein